MLLTLTVMLVLMAALYQSWLYGSRSSKLPFFGAGDAAGGQAINLTGPGTPNKADALAALGNVVIRELNGERRHYWHCGNIRKPFHHKR